MNFIQKIKYIFEPNPLYPGKRATVEYALIKYLGLRRSRFGLKPIINQLFKNHTYNFVLNNNKKFVVTGRFTDYGDFVSIKECFVDGIYDFSLVRFKPDLIIDIGSHIGNFVLLAQNYLPTIPIIAFEPDPGNFKLLQKNSRQNEINVEIKQIALSNYSGKKKLSGTSGINKRLHNIQGLLVNVCRLSEILKINDIQSLLLKIDAEGSEFDILNDCLNFLPTNTFIFVEVHEGQSAIFRLKHVLEPEGFSVHISHQDKQNDLAIDCYAVRGEFKNRLKSISNR